MLSGAFNGSSVFLRVMNGSDWLTIGGQMSHSTTENNSSIDITSKQNGHSFRDLQDIEGLKTFDVSGELIFNNDVAFDFLKAAYTNKSINLFQVVYGDVTVSGNVTEFKAMVSSWGEASPDNDKMTASVTLNSSEQWYEGLEFEQFNAAVDGEFFTSTGQPFFVRV